VIGAAMRKLVHLIYGVVKSGKPFDANFANKGLAIQDGI
ncbi:MAG: IS110 family transposase, partial [Sulfuriferula sp.]|nr:IS110 family transposase [Sulfuriferula sp.]NOT17630.1 IS110 family transposase [Sulfuriferula sp.]NOT17753.1 IS110 family transposase [Sulfuriferula sp.]NOT17754.1 IS110 family transposase [Sulfuriferula sp.]